MTLRGKQPVGLALCLALAGCTQTPDSLFPTADDALARMHAGYACSVGVQGEAKVDLVTKKGRVKGDVFLFAINPQAVRFDVVSPFGATIFTLTSDGKDFKLADLEQKTFFYGPATACNLARFTQVPVPGHALVSLLRGEAPVLVHDRAAPQIAWDGDHYKLTIPSKNEASEEIHLQVHPDDFHKPWQKQRVRVSHVRVAQGGEDLYLADLSGHEPTKTAPARVDEDGMDEPVPPSGPACEAEYPKKIRFRVSETRDDVVFEYKEAKWNPPLLPETFTQPVPGGMRKQLVTCKD
ncbi:MAG: hypothetical protein JNL21_14225 [Myxococcales bacterium]|nr:hypothetical protein [Myxococcales bacterium]